jgi:TPR repeat protein
MGEVISAVEVKVSSEDQPVEPDVPDTEELQSEESSEPTDPEADNTADILDQAVPRKSGRGIMPWAAVLVLGAVVGLGYWMTRGPVGETKADALIQEAEGLNETKEWDEALAKLQEAQNFADQSQMPQILQKMGYVHYSKGEHEEAADLYRKAAEQGHASAQSNLGYMYDNGEGVPEDDVEAVKWFRKAADQGNASAQYYLGVMYANGRGVPEDDVPLGLAAGNVRLYESKLISARRIHTTQSTLLEGLKAQSDEELRASILTAHPDAELDALIRELHTGQQTLANQSINLEEEHPRIKGLKEVLATLEEQIDDRIQDILAGLKLRVKSSKAQVEKLQTDVTDAKQQEEDMREKEAVKWYRKAAEQGDATAQYSLGLMYYNGKGVPKDDVEAVKWYRKAAEQGDATAQFYLGVMYAAGKGVPEDDVEAVKWYRKAAEQEDARAQYMLGEIYEKGNGVLKDDVEAVKWYRKAAEQEDARAQYNLGFAYRWGQGVPKDDVEAVKWLRKAADQDNAQGQFSLGVMCYNGKGVPEDKKEAVKWYRKAADQGHRSAQYYLGAMYYYGEGVPKDDVEAYKWYSLSAAQGNEGAKKSKESVAGRMTAEQITEAQKRSADFKQPRSESTP